MWVYFSLARLKIKKNKRRIQIPLLMEQCCSREIESKDLPQLEEKT